MHHFLLLFNDVRSSASVGRLLLYLRILGSLELQINSNGCELIRSRGIIKAASLAVHALADDEMPPSKVVVVGLSGYFNYYVSIQKGRNHS